VTAPQPPQTPNQPTLQLVLEHAAEALALERAARGVAAPLRAKLKALTRTLSALWVRKVGRVDEPADPITLHDIATETRNRLADIRFTPADELTRYAEQAIDLGVRQAVDELHLHATEGAVEHVLPATGRRAARFEWPAADLDQATVDAIRAVDATVAGKLADAETAVTRIAGNNFAELATALSPAQQAATATEATATWATNKAVNDGVAAVADQLDAERLWVAERDACVHCLAYSGHVARAGQGFPVGLTFGDKPLVPWPDPMFLPGCPLHPHCRCRITVWLGSVPGYTGPDLPAALRREAERSILTGWRMASESQPARLRAASRLLARGTTLPKSVQARARTAVRRGRFNDFPRKARS
jgi:hypothetical protein